MPTLTCIIFDCDGVLFDSRSANDAFYNTVITALGRRPMDAGESRRVHFLTGRDSLAYLMRDTPDLLDAALHMARQLNSASPELLVHYKRHPLQRQILERLAARATLGVVTNRGPSLHTLLRVFEIGDLFAHTVHAGEVTRPKPHPEGLLRVLDMAGAPAEASVYIGDNGIDAEAAESAGVHFVGFGEYMKGARHYAEDWDTVEDALLALESNL